MNPDDVDYMSEAREAILRFLIDYPSEYFNIDRLVSLCEDSTVCPMARTANYQEVESILNELYDQEIITKKNIEIEVWSCPKLVIFPIKNESDAEILKNEEELLNITENIWKHISEYDIPFEKLAKNLKMTPDELTDLMNGDNNIFKYLSDIAYHLHCEIFDLLKREDKNVL